MPKFKSPGLPQGIPSIRVYSSPEKAQILLTYPRWVDIIIASGKAAYARDRGTDNLIRTIGKWGSVEMEEVA